MTLRYQVTRRGQVGRPDQGPDDVTLRDHVTLRVRVTLRDQGPDGVTLRDYGPDTVVRDHGPDQAAQWNFGKRTDSAGILFNGVGNILVHNVSRLHVVRTADGLLGGFQILARPSRWALCSAD